MFRNAGIFIFLLLLQVVASAAPRINPEFTGSSFHQDIRQKEQTSPDAIVYQTLSLQSIFHTDASPAEEYRSIAHSLTDIQPYFSFFSQQIFPSLRWNHPSHHFW